MATQTLIKPQEIVTDGIFRPSNLASNFDQNLISPYIAWAEEGNVIRLLGQDLFDAMLAAQNPLPSNYNENAGPIVQKFPNDPNYEALWTKYLLRYEGLICVITALPFIGYQVTSQGVLLKNTEYAENAGREGITFLIDPLQKIVDDMEPRITSYLCDNKAEFPLYDSKGCPSCSEHLETCSCGYAQKYLKSCPKCITGRDSSTKVIFYN